MLNEFRAGPSDIRELYHFLIGGGADCWIHGCYVAAVSIANPIIIYAYLRDRRRRRERGFCLSFVDTCIRYIEGGCTETFLFRMLKVPPQLTLVRA